jgi:hypothetical protein
LKGGNIAVTPVFVTGAEVNRSYRLFTQENKSKRKMPNARLNHNMSCETSLMKRSGMDVCMPFSRQPVCGGSSW